MSDDPAHPGVRGPEGRLAGPTPLVAARRGLEEVDDVDTTARVPHPVPVVVAAEHDLDPVGPGHLAQRRGFGDQAAHPESLGQQPGNQAASE